jgi:glutamate-ammonia-ligase adenylyltransferase
MNTLNTLSFDALLGKTLRCSRYAKHTLNIDTNLLDWLRENYLTPCNKAEIQNLLLQPGTDLLNEDMLSQAIRRLRKNVMVKLILRDLNGLTDLNEVMQGMTALAETCVQHTQTCLMHTLQQQYGAPTRENSSLNQELLVIAMGKLGGRELNVSSDIDLIFIHAENGDTNGERSISNHEFFTKLGRRLINIINETTADGYVFRVDMRLRPYGDSGPLVMSFAALEEYLVSQGREWERYAWIKARVISPHNCSQIPELKKLIRPFVFRKYLDFGAIDSIRKLHRQIRQEVQRRNRLNNIKLGPGGIREIEFIAQVFQLIRGGRDAKLRIRPTQLVLKELVTDNHLSAEIGNQLDAAYTFLRNLEHRLQYLDDQQTQELPKSVEDQEIIAEVMGYKKYVALLEQLNVHRDIVSLQFEKIFGSLENTSDDEQLWSDFNTDEDLHNNLVKLDYLDSIETAKKLMLFRNSNRYRQLPDISRQRLDKLIPQFISLSSQYPNPDTTLSRLLLLLEGISRRASYLAFLAEYPQALQRLSNLVSASGWASEYLTHHPALLDELLNACEIYQPPKWLQIDIDLKIQLDDCKNDTERQFDILRHIQQEQTFHLLAMDLQGLLPIEKLSDHLSDLADLLLHHVLDRSWGAVLKRHCDAPRFAIIAYGKLGGRELGYASDLDLIFLFDDDDPEAQENYSRLAQRINTMLSSYTSSGRMYETDLRLRPNGESGLLVSSIKAFAEYQKDHAWIWEHQALTRARYSAGNSQISERFESIRQQTLCQQRDLSELRKGILAMRQKMHDGHPNNTALFDIKHDSGGMVDIEFMVQYLVLAYAHQHPKLTANIGNLALLKLAGELDLIPVELAEKTGAIYRTLRQTQHRIRLDSHSPCRVAQGTIETSITLNLWGRLFG